MFKLMPAGNPGICKWWNLFVRTGSLSQSHRRKYFPGHGGCKQSNHGTCKRFRSDFSAGISNRCWKMHRVRSLWGNLSFQRHCARRNWRKGISGKEYFGVLQRVRAMCLFVSTAGHRHAPFQGSADRGICLCSSVNGVWSDFHILSELGNSLQFV